MLFRAKWTLKTKKKKRGSRNEPDMLPPEGVSMKSVIGFFSVSTVVGSSITIPEDMALKLEHYAFCLFK